MLFGKLLPREGNFFELFNQHGGHIAEGSRAFIAMIQNYADPSCASSTPTRSTAPSARPTRSPPRSTGCCTRPSSRRSTASRSIA